uniref:Leptin-B-like n=1 Tax=Cyprinodon variegatus TaxID=28743 RepID=A0A3Q2DEH3_CYPVA
MCIALALLVLSLIAAPECTALPIQSNSIRNNIHIIQNIIQITLVHIKKLENEVCTVLNVTSRIEVSTPAINGLTGISLYLEYLDNELQSPFTDLLKQIQADVSGLDKRVRSLALIIDCPIQEKTSREPPVYLFPDSQHYVTLAKVQNYLENLLLNKDKLEVC